MTEDIQRMNGDGADTAVEEGGGSDVTQSMEEIRAEVEQLRRDAAEMLDQLQRSRAEFANFRRRQEQEAQFMRQRATERLILKLLPIADDFDRAMRSVPQEIADHPWIEGVRLVERKFWSVLEGEGISVMESVGTRFDPSRHEAVMVEEGAGSADTVVDEFQRGYLMNDSVLRPAMVKVGAGNAENGNLNGDENTKTNTTFQA